MTALLLDRPRKDTARRVIPRRAITRRTIPRRAAPPERPVDRTFRPDIQGLRAIAVLLVILYHAGVPGFGGGYIGVDVFFVISGFLITRQLQSETTRTGTFALATFYARRIRRLAPPALLVLASTVLVARIWGPALTWGTTAWHAVFASFYSLNYRLAAEGIDYQNATAGISPLQHLWSLSVEEQFYIVWPVLMLVVIRMTRRTQQSVRQGVLAGVAIAAAAVSLQISIALTRANAPLAYFSLQTRAWELLVGALLAIGTPWLLRLPQLLASVSTWVGLLTIVLAATSFSDTTPFPGWLAAIPVTGAALIVGGGVRDAAGGMEVAVRSRPVQFIGRMSYGWYLWHFPANILGPSLFDLEFTVLHQLEMSALALWLAVLTHLLVERPSQRTRLDNRTWFRAGASMSGSVIALSVAVVLVTPALQGRGPVVPGLDLGRDSAARLTAAIDAARTVRAVPANLDPQLGDANSALPKTTTTGCHLGYLEVEQPDCVFGDPQGDKTLLLFGDSHAEQWFGALDTLARQNGWRLVSWTKAACPVADVVQFNTHTNRNYTECGEWRRQRLQKISELRPNAIVASQFDSLLGPNASIDLWAQQTTRTLRTLATSTRHLYFIADTPLPDGNVPECLAGHLEDASACNLPPMAAMGSPPGTLLARRSVVAAHLGRVGVNYIDPTRWFCSSVACPVVIGNVLVYRDVTHVSQTYSRALAPLVAEVIDLT